MSRLERIATHHTPTQWVVCAWYDTVMRVCYVGLYDPVSRQVADLMFECEESLQPAGEEGILHACGHRPYTHKYARKLARSAAKRIRGC